MVAAVLALLAAAVRIKRSRADGVLRPPIVLACVFRAQDFSNACGEASGESSFVAESNALQSTVFFAAAPKIELGAVRH